MPLNLSKIIIYEADMQSLILREILKRGEIKDLADSLKRNVEAITHFSHKDCCNQLVITITNSDKEIEFRAEANLHEFYTIPKVEKEIDTAIEKTIDYLLAL